MEPAGLYYWHHWAKKTAVLSFFQPIMYPSLACAVLEVAETCPKWTTFTLCGTYLVVLNTQSTLQHQGATCSSGATYIQKHTAGRLL